MGTCEERGTLCQHDRSGSIFLYSIVIRIPIAVLQSSFAEIARLLSEFFRELDVVPSDVLAGLIMLRQRQQQARQTLINQVGSRV